VSDLNHLPNFLPVGKLAIKAVTWGEEIKKGGWKKKEGVKNWGGGGKSPSSLEKDRRINRWKELTRNGGGRSEQEGKNRG